jgi:hypothetical protein
VLKSKNQLTALESDLKHLHQTRASVIRNGVKDHPRNAKYKRARQKANSY